MPLELHTERLRKETGADRITCDVLHHDIKKRRRLVNIVSETGGHRTIQTVAYTFLLPHRWTDDVARIDQLLKAGSLMGETFRNQGYTVRQNQLLKIHLPFLSRKIASQFKCERWDKAEVEVYEFWANSTPYGFIVEFKHSSVSKSPNRKKAGHYATLYSLGLTHESFFKWLDDPTSEPHLRILTGRMTGVIVGVHLSLRALWHAPRWIDAE